MGGPQDPDQDTTPPGLHHRIAANSLADLTNRENRFGHNPKHVAGDVVWFPHSIDRWGQLGLPTLRSAIIRAGRCRFSTPPRPPRPR